MNRGNYIAFEGADGTGKTTLSKLFAERMEFRWTYEPNGEDEVTKTLRSFCLEGKYKNDVNWRVREYLLLASRASSTRKVEMDLKKGISVVSDRSLVSGLTYAHVASGMTFGNWWLLAHQAFWCLPQVIVYVQTEKQSIKPKGDDIYDNEKEAFHSKIKNTFPMALDFLKERLNFRVIHFQNDFDKTPEENLEALIYELQRNYII